MIKQLAKSVLVPLELTTAASAADAGTHKKTSESGNMTTLIYQMMKLMMLVK